MRIIDFSFTDALNKLNLKKIEFGKTNLLVGISGAGKTTIMNAFGTIKSIASGKSSPGDKWTIRFISIDKKNISWSGEFSSEIDYDEENKSVLLNEEILLDGKILYSKNDGVSFLNGTKLPALDKFKSIIHSLRDDDSLRDIYNSLQAMTFISSNGRSLLDERMIIYFNDVTEKALSKANKDNKITSFDQVNELFPSLDIRHKLFFCHKYDKERFDDFSFLFKTIFPNVKEIKPTTRRAPSQNGSTSSNRRGVSISLVMEDDSIVSQETISSGMFKSMMIMAYIYLGVGNNVLFIDEIENGLGVNCLPDIISELQSASIQTIISTHHPRIINEITPKDWRIVTRNGCVISANKATEIMESTSAHDSFIKLINSKQYRSSGSI